MPSRHYTRSIIPCKSVLSLVDRTPLPRRGVPPPFRTFPESISRSRPKSFASTHSLWYKLRAFCRVTRSFSSSSLAFNPQAAVGEVTDRTVTSYVDSREIDARELPSVPVALVDASEGEWLQDEREDDSRSICTPDPPQVRLDWRLRASSRVKKENKSDQEKRRHPRRKRLDGLNPDPDEPYYRSFEAYRSKFLYLLRREEEEESAALKHRLSTWGIPRLEREGYCLTKLSAYWLEANHFGNPVASFSLGPGIKIPDSKLEKGTQILLSRHDPLKELPETGSVIARNASDLRVCFASRVNLSGIWRLDLGLPNLMFERMRSAISYLGNDLKRIEEASDNFQQYILQGTELRDVLLQSFQPLRAILSPDAEEVSDLPKPVGETQETASTKVRGLDLPWEEMGAFKHDQRIVSWVKRHMKRVPIVLDSDPPLELNDSQRQAVAAMIGRRISLIQGPPGTGKTKTIIETVKLLKTHFEVPHPILVGTFTNVAVDNLVEGLAKAGVKPLRVGSPGNIRQSLIPHSLDYKLQCHALYPTFEKAVNDLGSLTADIAKFVVRYGKTVQKLREQKEPSKTRRTRAQNMLISLEMMKQRSKKLESKVFAIRQEMLRDVVSDADVVCTTCLTAACSALNVVDFPVVFLDEASMSTEPASLVAIMKGSQHLALIGDHKQLPPVIVSKEAKEGGLNVSLFERLTEEGHVHSVMLNTQYRMHPDISRFPAEEFYEFELRDGTVDKAGDALPGLEPPISTHLNFRNKRPSVIFVDHGGNESMKGRSRVNVTEAHLVASVVEDLLLVNKGLQGHDIGIIAPYAAQITLLLRFLNTDPQYQERFKTVLGVQRAMQMQHVEIKTVDGFEGREKDVIIFSTVRNNESGYIGFLADKKRLNVGLTRAKRGLFVLGSIATLRAGKGAYDEGSSGIVSVTEGYIKHSSDDNDLQAHSKKKKKKRGHESWQRYAQFMLEKEWVVSLQGNKLEQVLYGHWNSLRSKMEADDLAEVRRGGRYPEDQPKALRV